jgi:hypothetical protein
LAKLGLNFSFIDQDELKNRGMKESHWKLVSRGIINPLSLENKIFRENLVF